MGDLKREQVQQALSQTLTPSDAAKKYNVPRRTLYNWIESEQLPIMAASSGTVVIWEPDLQNFLASRPSPSASPSASASPDDGTQGTWKSGETQAKG